MDQNIQDFIQLKRLAILGVSRSGKKFGNSIHSELKQRGVETFIVHPQAEEIDGAKCYPNLAALQGLVDGVVICLPPSQSGQALRDAAASGIRKVWLQHGAESPEVLAIAKELDLQPVAGKCILMYAPPVRSFHGWHRWFARVFGQL